MSTFHPTWPLCRRFARQVWQRSQKNRNSSSEDNTPEPPVIWGMAQSGCFGIRLQVATETHLCIVLPYVDVDSGMRQHSPPLPQGYLRLDHSGFPGIPQRVTNLWVSLPHSIYNANQSLYMTWSVVTRASAMFEKLPCYTENIRSPHIVFSADRFKRRKYCREGKGQPVTIKTRLDKLMSVPMYFPDAASARCLRVQNEWSQFHTEWFLFEPFPSSDTAFFFCMCW